MSSGWPRDGLRSVGGPPSAQDLAEVRGSRGRLGGAHVAIGVGDGRRFVDDVTAQLWGQPDYHSSTATCAVHLGNRSVNVAQAPRDENLVSGLQAICQNPHSSPRASDAEQLVKLIGDDVVHGNDQPLDDATALCVLSFRRPETTGPPDVGH